MTISNTYLKNMLLLCRKQWLDSMVKHPNTWSTMPTWWAYTSSFFVLWKWMIHRFLQMCSIRLLQFSSRQITKSMHVRWRSFRWKWWVCLKKIEFWYRCYLHNGGFSVNRTENSFLRVGIDKALEQTMNIEASIRLLSKLRASR